MSSPVHIYTILEQVLIGLNSPNNIPENGRSDFYASINEVMPNRNSRLVRAEKLLDKAESLTPPHLVLANVREDAAANSQHVLQAHRISVAINFARTLIVRQRIVADIDNNWDQTDEVQDGMDRGVGPAQRIACAASKSTVDSYSELERLGLLGFFNFQAVLHLMTAGHTLLACMLKERSLQESYMIHVSKSVEYDRPSVSEYLTALGKPVMLIE